MFVQDSFEFDYIIFLIGYIIEDMQFYGYCFVEGEVDFWFIFEDQVIQIVVFDIFDVFILIMVDISFDFDFDEIFWLMVNIFYCVVEWIECKLDDNEQVQKCFQCEQDGSEVKFVQFESLIGIGGNLIECCESLEFFCEIVVDIFLCVIGIYWVLCLGLCINYCYLMVVMIDSCDFFVVKKIVEIEMLVLLGLKVVFLGGDIIDYCMIWDCFDQIYVKYLDMVLMYGGSLKGVECIVVIWVSNCKVLQVVFKLDWMKYVKVVFFKCNDQMFDCLLIGVIIFFGIGIQENFVDKVCKMGILVYCMVKGGV